MLTCDFFERSAFRVRSYEQITTAAEAGDKAYRFLLKWSDLEEETFELARANKSVLIPIKLNIYKYHKYLREKFKEEYGEYPPEDYPLLSYPLRNEFAEQSRQDKEAKWKEDKIEKKDKRQKAAAEEKRKQKAQ